MDGFLTSPTTAGLDSDEVPPVVTVADPRMWPHLRPKGAPGRKGEVEGVVTELGTRFEGWLMRTSFTITRWQRRSKKGPSSLVVVGRRPCEPLNNPTLLSLGGENHLKRESHPSPIRLVF
jgi:hypothetical protein